MATKRTQRNSHRSPHSLSPIRTSNHNRTNPEFLENHSKIADSVTKKKVYITAVDNLVLPRIRAKTLSKITTRPKDVYMPCRRHGNEGIKYVDITPKVFEGICDVCILRSEGFGKNMKLERLVALYNTKWEDLNKACEELKDIETKITKIYKEIVRENLKAAPILKELDDMERKVTREVERSFRKIKAKFIKLNPFKETREMVKNYLEGALSTLNGLEEGTTQSFELLRSMYLNENKVIDSVQGVIRDMNSKIEMDMFSDPLQDKDFGILVYEYSKFFDKITGACTNFANNIKVTS